MHVSQASVSVIRLSLQDPLEFPAKELKKYFKMGDHVKVLHGRYEGDTGLIVRVEDNMVVLFSDLTMHEVSSRSVLLWLKREPLFLTGNHTIFSIK